VSSIYQGDLIYKKLDFYIRWLCFNKLKYFYYTRVLVRDVFWCGTSVTGKNPLLTQRNDVKLGPKYEVHTLPPPKWTVKPCFNKGFISIIPRCSANKNRWLIGLYASRTFYCHPLSTLRITFCPKWCGKQGIPPLRISPLQPPTHTQGFTVYLGER
jgi:hypothetical protein